MQTIEQLLAEAPAFNGMSEEHLALIAGCAPEQDFAADGEYLMREGDPATPSTSSATAAWRSRPSSPSAGR